MRNSINSLVIFLQNCVTQLCQINFWTTGTRWNFFEDGSCLSFAVTRHQSARSKSSHSWFLRTKKLKSLANDCAFTKFSQTSDCIWSGFSFFPAITSKTLVHKRAENLCKRKYLGRANPVLKIWANQGRPWLPWSQSGNWKSAPGLKQKDFWVRGKNISGREHIT